ncbi:flavin reductase family protein [Spirosoma montaniterrae]|uniref:Flavin reductase n=1 Tax=Spirosoma montaniterrae TaxID=1178516 RepID=A0A1P9X3P3_9BACT|nr:flavin reductase family protein [Spirosoma montaniterrae]AQG82241.1 flavin reductase [Spirosoma montaniterrae]
MTQTIDPADLQPQEFYRLLNSTVAPRPIAFVSTVSQEGHVNLAPYSFFNMFGFNPPILVFSPTRNRHGHKKHSLLNVEEVPEVVINVVSHAMVEQTSLASAEFDRHVSEFTKAGFTELPSERVKPPRVAEALVSFECRVRQLLPVGDGPGAGTLVICEVILAHVNPAILTEKGTIDPHRLDLVGRLGGDWYVRASHDALFEVGRPQMGAGVDALPANVRQSNILTGNDLGKLGSIRTLPTADDVAAYRASGVLNELFDEARTGCQYLPDLLHLRAKQLLAENNVQEAWLTLLSITA